MYDIQSVSITHIGKVRSTNEDAVLEGGRVFAVADGMGGHRAGEVASSMAITQLKDCFGAGWGDTFGPKLLRKSIEAINAEIYEKASSTEQFHDMGTTLTIVFFGEDNALIGNVGDSRAYLFRDGRLERLTHDDSLVAKMIDEGLISEDEAQRHPQRNVILKALGVQPDIDFEVIDKGVEQGDLFLLSTDGLTSLVEDSEIEAVLTDSVDIEKKAKRLLRRALNKGGTDNISIVIIAIRPPADAAGEDPEGSRKWTKRVGMGRFFNGKRIL